VVFEDCEISGAELPRAVLGRARPPGSALRDPGGLVALVGAVLGTGQQLEVARSLRHASGIIVDDQR
jgi:hypothetical protein